MSKLGKSFKNKFLRRALAMLLTGTMVLSGMPASFAAEQRDAGSTVETELQGRTEDVSEEAAEEDEVAQNESEETEAGEESRKPSEESETISKEETTVQSDKESENAETETYEITSVIETEESETNTEEEETEQTTEEEENEASYTSSDAAVLAENHTYAVWGLSETLIKSDGTNATADSTGRIVIQSGNTGIYKNSVEDILYIDTKGSSGNGKFGQGESDIQINANTKIYIPVKADNHTAKIIIYQKNANTLSTVINREGSDGYFDLTGEALSRADCTSCEKTGDYYKAELVCTLTDGAESAVICVEVKKNNYATKIISGEEVRDDVYDDTVGASADFVKYNMEGYANAYGVTGGGVIKEGTANYYTVSTADDFIETLKKIKTKAEPAVIRITENLNLGSKEFKRINVETYDRNLIRGDDQSIDGDIKDALMHPVLKRTGVSHLTLKGFKDLTIFSTNGAAIKHCKITIQESNNIMFRNLVFDELWEWDDIVYVDSDGKTSTGQYDRNDWDYMTIDENSDGVWVDHCTFYKAYDGIIDVKKAKGTGEDQRVTVSWCKFEPKSAPKTVNGETTYPFYDAQMRWLEANKSKTQYYKALTAEKNSTVDCKGEKESDGTEAAVTLTGGGYSAEDVITYTCGQKKTHLLGQSDTDNTAKGIRVTLANNSYKNSMDRMPRLRFGKAHIYNCVLDASELYEAHYVNEGGSKFDSHLVSNGALSTLQGYVYLEHCYIDGIKNPLVSGNDKSAPGYIGANSNCIYMLNGQDKTSELRPKNNNSSSYTGSKDVLEINNISELGLPDNYGDYSLYNDVSGLASYLSDKAGAGVVVMNPIRWTKTNYNGTTDTSITDEKDDTDPARNDNTDYSIGEEGGGDTPPETDPDAKPEKKALDAKDVYEDTATEPATDVHTIDKEYTSKDGFVIKADASNTVTVDASSKSPYTHRIKLGGAGDSGYRSIHFATTGSGTLTVYAISSSSTATTGDRVLELYKAIDSEDKFVVGKDIKAGSDLLELSYTIDGAGDYWIGSKSGGINIYHIDLEYTAEEGGENPPTPPTIEYPEDSLILDANELPDITIETEQKINNQYAIIGTSDAAVTIGNINEDGSAITINEKEFSKQIQLGGAGDSTKRTIKITVAEAGKLAVYAQTEGTEDGTLVLKGDLETSQEAANTVTASEPAVIEYTVSEAGTYYLYSTDSNINIFYAEYTVGPADDGEKTDTFYDATEGDSAELTKYNLEGFAASARVTGGGLLKEGSKNYYRVTNEQEFLDALNSVRSLGTSDFNVPAAEITPAVIEIVNDLNLGCKELEQQGIDLTQNPAKTVLEKTKNVVQPSMHPTLKKTGVSVIKLNYFHNLTIYSKTGASIKHAGISFEGASSNIIIRNITFDEFWEWDDIKTKGQYGQYDKNDWDYMTISEQTDGLWIDHCTFYKSYDGIIDVKGDNKKEIDRQRVTISWCEFLPGSKNDTFFDEQMTWLENNKASTDYYKVLRDTEKMSAEDVRAYAYGQKKTHLFGADDADTYAAMIRVTMANNYYKNSMDRMPRLRYGRVHEYNCILDAQDLYDKRTAAKHITSNGAISTCGGEVLLENCQIKGIENPLLSGNGSSPTGYINAINSLYYIDGEEKELTVSQKGTGDKLITDAEAFKNAIPYKNYVTYDASMLESTVMPNAGAGKLRNLSTVQWEKVSYGVRTTDVEESYTEGKYGSDAPDKPTAVPGSETQATAVASGTKIELKSEGADKIFYTRGATLEDTADPTDPKSAREEYNGDTGIIITEAVTIKAAAQKGAKYSEIAVYSYTIEASEEKNQVESPKADLDPEAGAVAIGTSVTLTCVTEGATIYYTLSLDGTPAADKATLYTEPIVIPKAETVTIKAYAVRDGWLDSAPKEFQYTVKSGIRIVGLKEAYAYTGAKIIPDIDVIDYDNGEKLLAPGVDYTVTYKNNTKPTTASVKATIIVKGKGNYAGQDTSKTFEIKNVTNVASTVNVKGAKIDTEKDAVYDGTAKYPDFTLKLKSGGSVKYTNPEQDGVYRRTDGADMDVNVAVSNNVNKGTATILVSGGSNTSVKKTFRIIAVDLSKGGVTVAPIDPVDYAVQGAVPKSIVVKYGDKELENGKDYTVKYSNNKKVGQGSIAITGKGNYAKKYSRPVVYTIGKLDLNNIKVSAVTACNGMKAGKVKAVVVDGNGTALKASQYTLKFFKDEAGTVEYKATDILKADDPIFVTANAKDTGNLSGETKIMGFKVAKEGRDISKATVKANKSKSYTGVEIELEDSDLTVTLNGSKLRMGEGYEVIAYSNNINKGSATAVIRGINDYSGTKTIKFKITQKTMKIKADDVAKIANGIKNLMMGLE